MQSSNLVQSMHISRYDVVRVLLACLLLPAAALKGYQLATEPVLERGFLESRWFLIGVVEMELFFGIWLVVGAAPRLTWLAAVACFSGFALVSGYKGVVGEASCGCFGRLAVNPWYTWALDVAAVGLLLVSRPTGQGSAWREIRQAVLACVFIAMAIGVPAGWAMVSFQAGTLSADGVVAGSGNLVLLTPKQWIGKRFPLLNHVDIGSQIAKGAWLVVLYHPTCPQCEELIAKYRQHYPADATHGPGLPVAFIEVPELDQDSTTLDLSHLRCLRGHMDRSHQWFVTTPAVVLLENAIVRQAYEGSSAEFFAILAAMPERP